MPTLAMGMPCLGNLILLFVPAVAVSEELLSNKLNWEGSNEMGIFMVSSTGAQTAGAITTL